MITPATGAAHTRIMSVGAYRPERLVTNDEVCERIDSSDTWIRERSGIVSRFQAADGETVVDLAERASRLAIERAGLSPADIDAVLVATISHPYQTPAAATLLADRLGAGPAAAFDISAACAGFSYGVSVASDMVRGGSARHVLVVGSERMLDIIDPYDRSTAFLFGDGAGAVVIGPSDTPGIGPTVWGSDGSQSQAIAQSRSWMDLRDRTSEFPHLAMQGQAVFRWAVWQMSPEARKAIEAAGLSAEDLAAFVPHQANARIIDAMAKQLRLPKHVHVAKDVVDSGNTSGASIPLALDRLLAEGSAASGAPALLFGFGAGLAWAGQVVLLP